ncbi:hypothetical protein D1P53_001762 [Cryptococcus gattii VGV]|nr:hypothetical protein D1P53_001762 [Cryptococcus gattii VGV]
MIYLQYPRRQPHPNLYLANVLSTGLDKAETAEVVDDDHHVSTIGMMMEPEGLWITKARTCFEVNMRAVYDSATMEDLVTLLEPMRYATPLGCIWPVDDILRIFDNGGHGTIVPLMDSANYLRQASALSSADGTRRLGMTLDVDLTSCLINTAEIVACQARAGMKHVVLLEERHDVLQLVEGTPEFLIKGTPLSLIILGTWVYIRRIREGDEEWYGDSDE